MAFEVLGFGLLAIFFSSLATKRPAVSR